MHRAFLPIAALALFLAACSGPAGSSTAGHSLNVSVAVDLSLGGSMDPWEDVAIGDSCAPRGTFASDIQPGRDVVVADESGTVLAMATLGDGAKLSPGICTLSFGAMVPDAAFYKIKIGDRPEKVVSRADMESEHWTLHWSLALAL